MLASRILKNSLIGYAYGASKEKAAALAFHCELRKEPASKPTLAALWSILVPGTPVPSFLA